MTFRAVFYSTGRNLLFSVTVFTYSCVGKTDPEQIRISSPIKEMPILVKPDSIITKVSEIALDISYIPLQPAANTPIKAVDKVITCGNKLYVNIISNILCFDEQGKFLYKLFQSETDKNNVGIYDFDIDFADTSLFVLAGNTILYYNNTGSAFEYKRTIDLRDISASKLSLIPGSDKILLSCHRTKGYEPALHYLINFQGEILSFKANYFNRFNPVKNYIRDELLHYEFENKVFCRERFNDTIFSVDNKSIKFIGTTILNSRLSSTNSENIKDPMYFKILPNVINIFETSRYLYYAYNIGPFHHKIFYDKNQNIILEVDPEYKFLKDDISGGPDFIPKLCSEGNIYTWISMRRFKEYIESEAFSKSHTQNPLKKQDLKQLSYSKLDYDNPIIIVLKPKR